MKRKRSKRLTDQLRQIVSNCGETRYRIAQETGIDESALSRFVNGERGVSMTVLDKLGEYLGLELVVMRPPRKKKR